MPIGNKNNMKIIFCDKNKSLKNKIEQAIKETENKTHCELIISQKDLLKTKKEYPNALIATASNPDFSMGGGIDGIIKKEYPEECENSREFKFTKNLFFTVTCDKELKSSKKIIQRALLGIYFASRNNDIILTGLGTGIAGLSEDDFVEEFKKFISADFRSADFSSANFYCANFSSANFSSANFNSADFSSANFSSANFNSADFSSADFNSADFRCANFYYADFSSADFNSADFRYANFSYANFRCANFRCANFYYANFRCANFYCANFSYANFSSANFNSADFSSANFYYANFSYANFKNIKINYKIVPEEGKIIGWKKANNKIMKLEIQNVKNVSGGLISRKLRTNKVKVLEIQELSGKKSKLKEIKSDYDKNFIYKVGKTKTEKDYIKNDLIECDKGIHFFLTRDEAVNY